MITLATLPEATAQEVFNQAVRHLHKQNAKSETDGVCLYNGGFGKKCVAGCFISDDEYDEKFEEHEWWSLQLKFSDIPNAHSQLLEELQQVHDCHDVTEWKTELKVIAEMHSLTYPSDCEAWEGQS